MDNQQVLEKEIDLIQGCITRISQNSFMVKGWLMALIAVVLALLPEKLDGKVLCIIILVITFCFWYLDAFFLKTEKMLRCKYDWVIQMRLKTLDFCYNLTPNEKSMWLPDIQGTPKNEPRIVSVMFTKTLAPLYGTVCIVTIIAITAIYLNIV